MRHWLAATVAAVGTLATFKLMADYRSWKREALRRKAEIEKRARGRALDPLVRKGLPTDKQLLDAAYTALQKLQRNEEANRAADLRLVGWLRDIPPLELDSYRPGTRLLCAQWLELHTLSMMASAKSSEAYNALVEVYAQDLEIAWKLLQCRPDSSAEQVAVKLLRLKVATRLKDHKRMLPIFLAIVDKLDTDTAIMMQQEVLAAFLAAPLLGRWDSARRLGQKCVQLTDVKLEDLHKKAQDSPNVPDMKILHELAEEKIPGLTDKDLGVESIRWTEYLIKGLRIKVHSVECPDPQKRQQVRQNFQSKMREWKVINIPNSTKVLRSGCIAQMFSFSANPIPMVGPATESTMLVRGYATTIGGTQSEEIHIENPNPNASDVWRGHYTCVQDDGPKVTLRISIEMTLREDDEKREKMSRSRSGQGVRGHETAGSRGGARTMVGKGSAGGAGVLGALGALGVGPGAGGPREREDENDELDDDGSGALPAAPTERDARDYKSEGAAPRTDGVPWPGGPPRVAGIEVGENPTQGQAGGNSAGDPTSTDSKTG